MRSHFPAAPGPGPRRARVGPWHQFPTGLRAHGAASVKPEKGVRRFAKRCIVLREPDLQRLVLCPWAEKPSRDSEASGRTRDKLLEVRAGQEALVCEGRFGGRQAGSFQPQDRRPAPTPTVGKARRGPGKSAGGTLSMEAVTRPLSQLWAAPSAPRAARSTCWPDTAPRTEEWTFKQS